MAVIDTNVRHLESVSEEEFRRYVDEDIRRTQPIRDRTTGRTKERTPDEIQALEEIHRELSSPEVLERWFHTLLVMKKSVEAQLGAKRADLNAKSERDDYHELFVEYSRWKAGTLRFLNSVEETLLEARSLRYQKYVSGMKTAILAHKEAMLSDPEYDPDPADERLWQTIERTA